MCFGTKKEGGGIHCCHGNCKVMVVYMCISASACVCFWWRRKALHCSITHSSQILQWRGVDSDCPCELGLIRFAPMALWETAAQVCQAAITSMRMSYLSATAEQLLLLRSSLWNPFSACLWIRLIPVEAVERDNLNSQTYSVTRKQMGTVVSQTG